MSDKSVLETLGIEAEKLFRRAAFDEYFGDHLFECRDQSYYVFSSDEKGNAVWIVEKRSQSGEREYEVFGCSDEKRRGRNRVVPNTCLFDHCEPIPENWVLDRRVADIESSIRRGGRRFGEKLNKAFAEVLLAACASQAKVTVQDEGLDETLAEVFSSLVKEGFHPDVFVFPEHLEAKLVREAIVVRDREIENAHYVGTTLSGQAAYWSGDFPHDTAVIFDSSIGVTIKEEPKFRVGKMGPFTPGVCGYVLLNPIVRNAAGMIAIKGIDIVLERRKDKTGTVQPIRVSGYVDLDRIEELRAISSTQFDLAKLVELCEEINRCYTSECYLAVAMLIRAVLDHVPPIFKCGSFVEVANNYGGRSLKRSLQHLQNSSRNIADAHLHLPIRSRESLPNKTQVNFSNDLDVLLAEVVRILK